MEEAFKWKRKRAFANDPIRKKKFFCGALPRADAEHLLERNGQFLIRVSEPTVEAASPFVISLRSQNGVFHVVILQTHKKKYHLGGPHFRTVNELVNHYVTKGLSVSKDVALFITEGIKRVSWILHDEDIEPIEKMGEGHFGEVWKVELVTSSRRKNMTRAAVKVLKPEVNSEMEKGEFFDECRKMRSLLHPNVVLFYGIVLDVEPLKLVMELCDSTTIILRTFYKTAADKILSASLIAYVRDNKGKIRAERKLRFCRHIACGMEYIASKQLIHRDLALRNCLLKAGVAKVADFGQAKQGRVYKMKKDTEEVLPVMWIPPDTLETRTFSEKSDVWAYGITIWELFTDGRHPYDELYPKLSHENFAEELMHIVARGYRMEAPETMPPPVQDIMHKCWEPKPEDRPSFKQIRSSLETASSSKRRDRHHTVAPQHHTSRWSGSKADMWDADEQNAKRCIWRFVLTLISITTASIVTLMSNYQIRLFVRAVYHMRPFLVVPLSNGTPYPPCSVCTSEMNICVEELCLIPIPFSDMEIYTMLALHNIKRSEAAVEIFGILKYQANMECLNNVSMDLTKYAQSLANRCNATDYSKSPYGITVFTKKGQQRIEPYEYMDKAEEYLYDYNIMTNELKKIYFKGVPKPFTEVEQYTILALHNSYRAQAEAKVESDAGETIVRQGNMECLTDKNDNMAMYAQGLANDCPDQLLDNGPYGLALFRRKNARKASPRSYINKAKQLLEHYKAPSNEFNEKQTPEQMNFVRQVTIDKELAEEAGKVAATCNQTLPQRRYGLAMVISGPKQKDPIKNYIRTARAMYKNNIFKDEDNKCSDDAAKCNLFRQVYWYEAHAMGCGKATCGNNVHVVCAYTYKQNPNSIPYIVAPYGISSRLCSSDKPYWDNRQKCCKKSEDDSDETNASIYLPSRTVEVPERSAEKIAANKTIGINENATTQAERDAKNYFVELLRFWDAEEKRNLLSTTDISKQTPGTQKIKVGIIGKIVTQPGPQCPQLMPIYWLYNGTGGTDIYTLHKERYARSYKNKGIIGYAVPSENICGANHPLMEFYRPGIGTIQLQRGEDSDAMLRTAKYGKYEYRGFSFWMWKA
ncbi:Tyrosine-protein kinase Fps85D [Trichuris trichiura]|uniref:Tyrosine-protein kinase n=1 Tax=Trichuris trichiura TaxID=36087 RepID=A0A077ZAT5_TRITR|nr:Tyrosine-protein kinase Fps85D [Trichuris trichiura]